ncbi:MAG TPA: hypothetical protein VMC62_07310, partial [Longilinea sp.]|nr:hypothetical protein [Longilinea sp.]
DYPQVNVAAEQNDPNSLLNFYRALIALRLQHSALRDSSLAIISTQNPGVFATLRYQGDERFLVISNLTSKAITDYGLSLSSTDIPNGSYGLKAIFGSGTFTDLTVANNGFQNFKPLSELPAYGEYILQLQP